MKTAVITGATKGIGKATAFRFAGAGFNIAFCARNEKEVHQVRQELEELYPKQNFLGAVCDVSIKDEIKIFGETILKHIDNVDVLVNNAGTFIPGQIHKEEDGVLEKMIATNTASAYHLTRTLARNMIQNRAGHIFNICSTASIIPYINGGSYCISKFALLGFSKVLREEMKEYGIKVTAILPGATLTDSWKGTELPEERFIKAQDVADVIFSAWSLSGNTNLEEILVRPMQGDI